MENINPIITVLTADFTTLKPAIRSTCINEPESTSLHGLANTLRQYADTCERIDVEVRQITEVGKDAQFIPYLDENQFLDDIQALPHSIVILNGIDPKSLTFESLKDKAWHRYEKVITDESFRGMAEIFPEQFIQLQRTADPRNPNKPSVQVRMTTDPEERYAKFVQLVNQRATMKDIAIAFGLSLPSAYLIRSQYKEELLNDPKVNKDTPAMKFNGKRSS